MPHLSQISRTSVSLFTCVNQLFHINTNLFSRTQFSHISTNMNKSIQPLSTIHKISFNPNTRQWDTFDNQPI